MLKQMIERIWSGGNSPDGSDIYAMIHNELTSNQIDPGLWTKAMAVSDGNTDKAKSKYIEMRANAIRNERNKLLELAERAHVENLRLEKASIEREIRSQELMSLRKAESSLMRKLQTRFDSPDAKRRKRNRNILYTIIYAGLCGLSALVVSQWRADEVIFILTIIIGFGVWLMSLATYGRYGLISQLHRVKEKIEKLNG